MQPFRVPVPLVGGRDFFLTFFGELLLTEFFVLLALLLILFCVFDD